MIPFSMAWKIMPSFASNVRPSPLGLPSGVSVSDGAMREQPMVWNALMCSW